MSGRAPSEADLSSQRRVDAAQLIDSLPITRLQYRVFLLTALCVLCEGYDMQSVAYVAPILTQQWHLVSGTFGAVFAAGLFGSALGSLLIAPLSDRLGRKHLISGSMAAVGVMTLGCAATHSLPQIESMRFLCGLGLGASLPNALALIAEYAPASRRTTIVSAVFCNLALGAAIGGGLAAWLVGAFGWSAVFRVGGAATLLLLPALLWGLPESLPFLASRAPQSEQTRATLRGLLGEARAQSLTLAAEPLSAAAGGARQLFRDGYGAVTVLYGALAFLTLMTLYLLNNWLPTLLHSLGNSLQHASLMTAAFQIGGILGAVLLGFAADQFGSILVVFLAYLAAATLIATLGLTHDPLLITFACLGSGFTLVGAQSCNNAMVASLYPVRIRGIALGWNLTIGRIGSILGPTVSGWLLMAQVGASGVLLLTVIPPLGAALALLPAGRLIRARNGA